MAPTLFTASWRALFEARDRLDVTPVRISRRLPKFWPAAAGFAYVEELAPDAWHLGIKNMRTFRAAYLGKLDRVGIEVIRARLQAIDTSRPLCLACYESRPADCHRSIASHWLRNTTGMSVTELEPPQLQLPTTQEEDR